MQCTNSTRYSKQGDDVAVLPSADEDNAHGKTANQYRYIAVISRQETQQTILVADDVICEVITCGNFISVSIYFHLV